MPGTAEGQGSSKNKDGADSSSSPAKRTKMTDTKLQPGFTSKASGKGSTGAGALAADGTRHSYLPHSVYSQHKHVRYFRKEHKFLTYGLATTPISIANGSGATTWNDIFMSTHLAEIPVQYLHFYVNPSEFGLLPNGSEVVHCKVTVTPRNVRVAFSTNAVTTSLATLNQNKNLQYVIGLNQERDGVNRELGGFGTGAGQEMIPSTITPVDYIAYRDRWYGTAVPSEIDVDVPTVPFGVPNQLTGYWCSTIQDTETCGWEDLQNLVTEVDGNAVTGTELIHYEYTPTIGLCKTPIRALYTGIPSGVGPAGSHTPGRVINTPTGPSNDRIMRTKTTTFNTNIATMNNQASNAETDAGLITALDPTLFNNTQIIEKSQQLTYGWLPTSNAKSQPSLHVGVTPVPAISTASLASPINSWTDVQAYFEVKAECWIECDFPTHRMLNISANRRGQNEIYGYSVNPALDPSKTMYAHLFQV